MGYWVAEIYKSMDQIMGYTCGTSQALTSPVSMQELETLNATVGFNKEDERFLHLSGEVLRHQTKTD
jgi:hypothetical protein